MRTIVFLAALAVAAAASAQEQKKEDAKKEEATQAGAKPAPVVKKKFTPRRFQDARHCLQKGDNTEIIKCAEAYL